MDKLPEGFFDGVPILRGTPVYPKEETSEFDNVKKPAHYNSGKYEIIDVIESVLNGLKSIMPFQAYCLGNALKYISRAGLKGDFTEDIQKAIMYLKWSIGEDPRHD